MTKILNEPLSDSSKTVQDVSDLYTIGLSSVYGPQMCGYKIHLP